MHLLYRIYLGNPLFFLCCEIICIQIKIKTLNFFQLKKVMKFMSWMEMIQKRENLFFYDLLFFHNNLKKRFSCVTIEIMICKIYSYFKVKKTFQLYIKFFVKNEIYKNMVVIYMIGNDYETYRGYPLYHNIAHYGANSSSCYEYCY